MLDNLAKFQANPHRPKRLSISNSVWSSCQDTQTPKSEAGVKMEWTIYPDIHSVGEITDPLWSNVPVVPHLCCQYLPHHTRLSIIMYGISAKIGVDPSVMCIVHCMGTQSPFDTSSTGESGQETTYAKAPHVLILKQSV